MKKMLTLISLLLIFVSWQTRERTYELTTREKQGYFDDLSRALSNSKLVKHLDLKYQKLSTIPNAVFSLTNLEILDLAHNEINQISERLIELPNLKKLYLNDNQIVVLPINFKELQITLLYIQNNPINNVNDLSTSLPPSIVDLEAGNPETQQNQSQPEIQIVEPEKVNR